MSINSLLKNVDSGVEAGKKAAAEVLALQKRVLAVLNSARYVWSCQTRTNFVWLFCDTTSRLSFPAARIQ